MALIVLGAYNLYRSSEKIWAHFRKLTDKLPPAKQKIYTSENYGLN